MGYIRVEYSRIDNAISEINAHTSFIENKMKIAQTSIDNLAANWKGSDFEEFKRKWEENFLNDSVYSKMKKSLTSYSEYLSYAKKQYSDAQRRAINRANNLPRW